MKKFSSVTFALLLSLLVFSGIASAHVTVSPKEATQGSYEVFIVRVPTEKEVPTVKVEVRMPADVAVSRFEPISGWKYDLTKDAAGKITSVAWTATGEGLSSTEFGDFKMQGKIGDNATELSWKAIQTYKDGSVVEWVGAAGSDKPSSVTKVNPKTVTAPAPAVTTDNASNSTLYIAVAALILGVISLLASLTRKRR
jgi:uncharacterized protein YcnI